MILIATDWQVEALRVANTIRETLASEFQYHGAIEYGSANLVLLFRKEWYSTEALNQRAIAAIRERIIEHHVALSELGFAYADTVTPSRSATARTWVMLLSVDDPKADQQALLNWLRELSFFDREVAAASPAHGLSHALNAAIAARSVAMLEGAL